MADVAPVTPDPGISDQTKGELNVPAHADEVAEINQKVHYEVAKLAANPADPVIVPAVRQWLINEMLLQGNAGSTTPSYEGTYSSALNREFSNLLSQPDTAVNTRLNIGIIINQLQGKTENLAPTVVQLLQDKSGAVVLWGEKAAGAILPVAVQDPAFNGGMRDKVLAAIVDAVIAHPDDKVSGMIADEAYRAINPEMNDWPHGLFPPANALVALVDANLRLQKSRIEIYKNTGVPESPLSDTYASYLLLGFNSVWSTLAPAQQLAAAQQASDLIWLAAQRAAGRPNNQNDELINALNEEGQWIASMGKWMQDANLQTIGAGVSLSVASPANTILDVCKAVYPAMQADFPTLAPPPSLDNSKSASDTSGPTTAASEAQR
ncbi:MAG TPA: hypothetical protein VHX86_12130 [Tepidisphaeraceae bacterium]|nr:hypothetical protein [Tepidisphaeraceae bacterium]